MVGFASPSDQRCRVTEKQPATPGSRIMTGQCNDAVRISWPDPPAHWSLQKGEIHVWAENLQPSAARISAFVKTLSEDETARAARFHFDRDRDHFIAGRGLLRAVLARYVGGNPSQLKFDYAPKGKPALSTSYRSHRLEFNVSHSGELILVAVAHDLEVGIDVEQIRPCADYECIAGSFFTQPECETLRNLEEPQKLPAFFRLWTCKEACLKATGEGISEGLGQVEVSFLEGEPALLINVPGDAGSVLNWSLYELAPAPGFIGALAAPASDITVNRWRWLE